MASLSLSSPGKPLRLKDFLREDANSDSSGGAGCFRTPHGRLPDKTVKYLLAVEVGESDRGDRPLRRCHSKGGTLTKITAAIQAVKMFSFASSPATCSHDCHRQGGFLPRSLPRKLRRSFWRKREKEHHRAESAGVRATIRVRDIVRLRSFGDEMREAEATEKTGPRSPPSPVGSTTSTTSGGGWSDTDLAGSDLSSSCGSSVCGGEVKDGSSNMDGTRCASPRSPCLVRGVGEDSISKATCHIEPKVKEETGGGDGLSGPCHDEEEKDQLSPVSVLDFPYERDDNDEEESDDEEEAERGTAVEVASSPLSFHRSLANLERTKHQLLQKIREFESLAALVDPVDLDSRFAYSEDELEHDCVELAGHRQELHEDEEELVGDDQLLQCQAEVEERAFALLRDLERRGGQKTAGGLLVDFFVERLSCSWHADVDIQIRTARMKTPCSLRVAAEEEALLRTAEDWMAGRRRGEDVHSRAEGLKEMDMDGRWRCLHVEEEDEVAGDLEARVMESLVDELLADLFENWPLRRLSQQ